MNRIATIVLASLASLGAFAASSSASYSTAPGIPRIVTTVNQNSTAASNATSYLSIQRCSGVFESPVFSIVSPTTCVANGPDYKITMEVVGPTQTRVTIKATATSCALKAIAFGNASSKCGYDLAPGVVGTINSGLGSAPFATLLVGAWGASFRFDNVVQYPTLPPAGDLYSRMTISFTSCFDGGDVLEFLVDTDQIG